MNCNGDCWNCEKEGCDNISLEDWKMQNLLDREINKEEIKKLTPKQIYNKRYFDTEKGRESKRRYSRSEKGRENNRKNALNYYYRNTELCKQRSKMWYQENKERVLEIKKRYIKNHYEEIKERTRKPQALYGWKKRFIVKNGRIPNEEEVNIWSMKYDEKRRKKENCRG